MRSFTLILLALSAVVTSGYYMTKDVKYADKDFLDKQKFFFDVFQHIHQDDLFMMLYKDVITYNIKDHYDHYDHIDYVKEFIQMYESNIITEYDVFSLFDSTHIEYLKYFYYTLYYAKDWDTFYKTVLWARVHINKGVFIQGLSSVVVHKKEFSGIVLPAIYEIYPWFFFPSDVLQLAQNYKMQRFHGLKKVEDIYALHIPANYTGVYGHLNDDNLLAYFMEDIGWNSFYYYYNLDYPYWTKGEGDNLLMKDRRGEFYFHVHWQMLARYYMERLSNGLGEIEEFYWYEDIEPGYYSGLRYYNGIHFPDRDNYFNAYKYGSYYDFELLDAYAHRILDAIDLGYIILPGGEHYKFKNMQDGIETIANLVQGNADSKNEKYYGQFDILLRQLVNHGMSYGKYEKELPGTMMYYSTSLRDPLFYMMYKRILQYFWYYLDKLPSYTHDKLEFKGVKITDVYMDKLYTFYDYFDAEISNAVDVEGFDEEKATDLMKFGRYSNCHGSEFVIYARQPRLNHKPFEFKVTVTSDKAYKAYMKVFIGPKYDDHGHFIHIDENRKNFFELDRFVVDLTEGKNIITRMSSDYSWFVNDRTTYYDLYKKLWTAFNSADYKFPLDMSEAHCGVPSRLMLPKGKKGGMPFQFFFMIMPYEEPEIKQFTGYDPTISCGIGSGARYMDNLPFGFPFDRPIDESHWHYDNMYTFDTMIYHKTESE